MDDASNAPACYLARIFEVDPEQRVQCECRDAGKVCGRPVYKEIHIVVHDDGRVETWGGDCYGRFLGHRDFTPRFPSPGGGGTRLSPEERQLLADNRRALLERWQRERDEEQRLAEQRRLAQQQLDEEQKQASDQRRMAEEQEEQEYTRLKKLEHGDAA